MGQPLTHGIYLPDEGERNCYNGLASNWSILDGAVGTVAEHSTQIAGKASLVHTHSKSDITDLLNSNFIPSANNSYDLGSSSYLWNNLYAKNYYYNGVAWGLDKNNTWTNNNAFNILSLYNNSITYNEAPSSSVELPSIRIFGGGKYCGAFDYLWKSTGENIIRLSLGSYKSDGAFGYWACNFGVPRDFSDGGKFGTPAFYPNTDGYNLGDSTHRWKTLNGVNPGALSLPSATSQSIDTTEWVTNSWSPNYCDAPFDGYISIACFANSLQINNETKSYGMTFQPGDDGFIIGVMPVCSGDHIKVAFVKTQTSLYEGYKFIKANGNV